MTDSSLHLSYFPGCAAHSTAVDQERSTRALCKALNIDLEELQDWNCCGATAAHTIGGDLVETLGARNIEIAEAIGKDLLVPCASCFGNLRKAQKARLAETSSAPQFDVVSIPTLLNHPSITRRLKERIVRPLAGLPIAAYYGCLLVRPTGTTDAANPENPMEMDNLITIMGGKAIQWSYKTECCGGAHTLSHPETVTDMSSSILDMASRAGAELIVTACPMCHSSLEVTEWEAKKRREEQTELPVLFLTELAALALAIPRPNRWLKRHLIDPRPLLRQKGLLP